MVRLHYSGFICNDISKKKATFIETNMQKCASLTEKDNEKYVRGRKKIQPCMFMSYVCRGDYKPWSPG